MPQTTKPRKKPRSPALRVLHMEHERFWEDKKHLPRFLFPFDYSLNPCSLCDGHCCGAQVHLTTVEAARIALTLWLPLDEVVRALPAEGGSALASRPIPTADQGEVRLALKHKDHEPYCVFLHDVAGRGMCSIYTLRPGVCRIFPYEVAYEGHRIHAGKPLTCAARWLYNEDTEARLAGEIAAHKRDLEEEERLLAAWRRSRRKDKSLEAFFAFALEKLGPLLGADPQKVFPPPRRKLGERPQ